MPLSVKQLLTPVTEDEALLFAVNTLESLGLVTDSWVDGSVQLNVLRACARTFAGGSETIANIVEGVLTKPRGDWLDLVGLFVFQLPRLEAIFAERLVTLTNAASAPAHVIADGSYLAAGPGAFEPIRFRVVGAHALAPGASISVPVVAEFAGASGNVAASQPLSVQTPAYSGVTAAFAGAPTINGVDRESDDRYWNRCLLRRSEETYSVGLRAYEFWALTAAPSVRRVKAINNYPFMDQITIILDPGDPSEIDQVLAYIENRTPPNDIVSAKAAVVRSVDVVCAPRVARGVTVAMLGAAVQSMADALPIGGLVPTGAIAGRFLRDSIVESILCKRDLGTLTVGMTEPAADTLLAPDEIVQVSFSAELSYV